MSTLGDKFKEIIHLPWDDFVKLEKDKSVSIDDYAIVSLIRLTADTDEVNAAKLSFDRIDGVQDTPVAFDIPKFYIRYPNAKESEQSEAREIEAGDKKTEVKTDYDPATAGLRDTLREMRAMPQQVIGLILKVKNAIDKGQNVSTSNGKIPQVKHVIVANLLKNVGKGRFRAIELVFDQIDGKLTRTIRLIGGQDIFVDDFNTLIAPAGSVLIDGVWHYEDKKMATPFIRGFARTQKGAEILLEELDNE